MKIIKVSSKSSREDMCRLPTSFKYSKSRQTGSEHAADSKLRYTIQFSILMLCAKYQEAGLCASREKCDRNYFVSKFAYVDNIQSHIKQEVDMPQIQKCITRIQFSKLMLCAKYQEAGLGFLRKMWQKFFVTPSTTQNDR